MYKKSLDTRKLTAQVSDMIADKVLNKLTAIGLTTENIRKLKQLEAAPPLDTVSRDLQAASLADTIIGQLAAISLIEENVKKLLP